MDIPSMDPFTGKFPNSRISFELTFAKCGFCETIHRSLLIRNRAKRVHASPQNNSVSHVDHPSIWKGPIPVQVIRVAICDPLQAVAESLKSALSQEPNFEVVHSGTSAASCRECYSASSADLLIAECRLNDTDVFQLSRDLRTSGSSSELVILTATPGDVLLQRLLTLPVKGIILKEEPLERIIQGLSAISKMGSYYSPEIRTRTEIDPGTSKLRFDNPHPVTKLSEIQYEIFKQLAYGHSVKEIASMLGLSAKSIDSHKYRIMNKLDLHDRVHLSRFAIREQLIDP